MNTKTRYFLYIVVVIILISLVYFNRTENVENSTLINNQVRSEFISFTGKALTIQEGFDVKKVNIWSTIDETRYIVCELKNNELVNVTDEYNDYYLITSINDSTCKGYCMKEFIVRN